MKAKTAVSFINLPKQHQSLKKAILKKWEAVIETGHFILGPETKALEKAVAADCGVKFAWGVNSGTDALILALRSLDLKPGDEVLIPDFTFVATATAVLLAGATPVLCDIDPATFHLDLAQAEKKITRRTRAIIPVHLYGQAMNMTRVLSLAKKHGLAVVEDNAQALGACWRGKPVGGFGQVGCLSFFPTKNLGALGDAGMVLTNDAKLAQRLNALRQHGAERKYYHDELGLNSRLDEIQSAALRVKLPYLRRWNARRQKIAAMYQQGLQELPLILPRTQAQATHVYHQYAVRSFQRQALQEHLAALGINTAVHYPLPLHLQPVLAHLPSARHAYPQSEAAAKSVLCLPVTPELTDAEVRRVIGAIRSFWEKD